MSELILNGNADCPYSRVTVIESRAVRFLLTKLRDKETKGKVGAGHLTTSLYI